MCIIIDINTIPSVFSKSAEDHSEFEPVFKWIIEDCGFMIYGGTKFKSELSKLKKYLGFLLELKKMNKIRECSTEDVDKVQKDIKAIIPDEDFDDPHIAAIIKVTGCRLICTKDARSVKYIQDKKIYNKGFIIPKFYTGKRNKKILNPNNIPDKYKPIEKIQKEKQRQLLLISKN